MSFDVVREGRVVRAVKVSLREGTRSSRFPWARAELRGLRPQTVAGRLAGELHVANYLAAGDLRQRVLELLSGVEPRRA